MKKKIDRGGKNRKFENSKSYTDKRKVWRGNEEKDMQAIKLACKNIESVNIKIFKDLPLSKKTILGLKDSGYEEPTEIQKESLCISLKGLDVLGAAKTGSGKTLAFIIPILEVLYHTKWVRTDGIGALVITPTRELAYQIFESLRNVGRYHDFSAGLIIGGKDLHFEKHRMDSCNIVICTPGRLLQHMDENPLFTCDNLQILVLDEADRCLDMGFEKTMNSIIENLPPKRQTLLFSATQTKSVKDLARLSLVDPMYVSVHEHAKHSTPEGLQQNYVVCELHEKIDMLWSFIKNHRHTKILVFLSSCKQVKYHYEMFCHLRPGMSLLALYGTLHQLRRMSIYEEFRRKQHVVLFATDIAARGLDFPEVNWVLQLDCPEDANTYIHRAGRTARYHKGGESLLVLLPSEEDGMVDQLKSKKIPINKIRVNPKKLQSPLKKMEALLAKIPDLKASAQRAFVSYLKSVYLMKNKSVFNIHALNTDAYSRSLGLAIPPKIRFLKKAQKLVQEKKLNPNEMDSCTFISRNEHPLDDDDPKCTEEMYINGEITQARNKESGFNQDESEDESGDDLLKIKRKDHGLTDIADCIQKPLEIPQKNKKVLTKVAIAKRILKKKIVANKKIVFDEDGEAIVNQKREKVSNMAREYEGENVGGIDIEKAKLVLKEEDKFDKQLFREKIKAKHRETKLKLKKEKSKKDEIDEENVDEESVGKDDIDGNDDGNDEVESEDDDDSGPDLSWLPDPDRIYGPKNDDCDDSEYDKEDKHINYYENNSQSTSISNKDSSMDLNDRLKTGTKRKKNSPSIKGSKRRNFHVTSVQQENLLVDEELALHLLINK